MKPPQRHKKHQHHNVTHKVQCEYDKLKKHFEHKKESECSNSIIHRLSLRGTTPDLINNIKCHEHAEKKALIAGELMDMTLNYSLTKKVQEMERLIHDRCFIDQHEVNWKEILRQSSQ